MQLTTALSLANGYAPNSEGLGQLSDFLCPDFIKQCAETEILGNIEILGHPTFVEILGHPTFVD